MTSHWAGSSLPHEKASQKINLNAKWRRILCYKKIQNIGVLCLALLKSTFFELLETLYSIVTSRSSSTSIRHLSKQTSQPCPCPSIQAVFVLTTTSLNYFLTSFKFLTKTDTRKDRRKRHHAHARISAY